MIANIINTFRTSTNFGSHDEVDLFQKLAIAIENYAHAIFIDETHGNVFKVEFTSIKQPNDVCEVADLLILAISDSGKLRATFWQAKKEKKSPWLSSLLPHWIDLNNFSFHAQINQWDLLARRPVVVGASGFSVPSDLLSSFSSPSIGTYGVFYERNKVVEVAHSIAELITCQNPNIKKNATLTMNGYSSKYFLNGDEIIFRPTLQTFLEALFAHQIGALLEVGNSAHGWLANHVRKKLLATGKKPAFLRTLDKFISSSPTIPDAQAPQDGGPSILIIRCGKG